MAFAKKNMIYGGAVFILVLSIISFVFLPAITGTSTQESPVFGKWNGTPIEYKSGTFLVRQIQTLSEQAQQQGTEVNQFTSYRIMQSAFNSAAIRLAILDELKQAGYKVPETLVNKGLIPYYQDENGKYSQKRFNDTPLSTRASRRSVLTEELTANRYVEDLFGTQDGLYGLKTSSKETELIKSMASPERSFSYVSFDTASYPDSEIAAWGAANPALFVKHDLSVITFDSEASAKKAAASIVKNEVTFEDAVTTWSTRSGTDTDGKLLKSFRNDLNALFSDAKDLEAVLALQPSAVSPVVKAGDAFAIVRCNAAPVDPDFADPAVIAAVKSYMNSNERGKIEDFFMAKAKEFSASARSEGFDAACRSAGLDKKTTTAFGINYGNANILTPVPVETSTELSAAVKSEAFFKTAFSLETSDVSEPVLLGSNVIVLQVAEEKAADPQVLEMIPMFYNYYSGTWSQASVSSAILKDKRFENDFMETYLKYFVN